jgi:hypothetical protein
VRARAQRRLLGAAAVSRSRQVRPMSAGVRLARLATLLFALNALDPVRRRRSYSRTSPGT